MLAYLFIIKDVIEEPPNGKRCMGKSMGKDVEFPCRPAVCSVFWGVVEAVGSASAPLLRSRGGQGKTSA